MVVAETELRLGAARFGTIVPNVGPVAHINPKHPNQCIILVSSGHIAKPRRKFRRKRFVYEEEMLLWNCREEKEVSERWRTRKRITKRDWRREKNEEDKI